MKRLTWTVLLIGCLINIQAQRTDKKDYVTIVMQPKHDDWTYKLNEKVELKVEVVKHYCPIKDVEVSYEWGPELGKALLKQTIRLKKESAIVTLPGAKEPGFHTFTASVNIDGKEYTNYINLAFEPDRIEPTTQMPKDFHSFWKDAIEGVRNLPFETLMTLQPQLCTPHADVYHVRFQNTRKGQYIYGMLAIPKGEGPFPAVLKVPGAGVRPYAGETKFFPQAGVITLEIGIHGIPVNMEQPLYDNLRYNALADYNTSHNDDRDRYYYKRVYLGCVRAVDWLCTLPQVDTTRLAVYGGSQGGALSIVTAALHEKITCLSANYPALCEIAGFYHGRAGGWPKIFKDKEEVALAEKVHVSEYYDVVNFARCVRVPGFYLWGYNDQVCCPTSVYSAYNVITAPKECYLFLDGAHWMHSQHREQQAMWLIDHLTKGK